MATATLTMSTTQQFPPLKRRRSPNLSLDLSSLPGLTTPAEPSNTLLITNLADPSIFTAVNLENITQAINAQAPIHTFSPLKSMRRIIVTFTSVEDAISVRSVLDGETVLGSRVRVYFGANTRIDDREEQHYLQAPKSGRLFFISPPPSPPVGWEMRNEGPPNKDVHAEDLASALAKLQARPGADDALFLKRDSTSLARGGEEGDALIGGRRKRANTLGTVVYDPEEFGDSPDLPAIAVEDTSVSVSPLPLTPIEGEEGSGLRFERTARPPVELME